MIEDDNRTRVTCEGCLTGNYYLCKSFPGQAQEHAKREIEFRKAKVRRLERAAGRFIGSQKVQVFRRDGSEDPSTEVDDLFTQG